MQVRRFLSVTAIVATSAALLATLPTANAHQPSTQPIRTVADATAPLQEFHTPGGGWFYTLNPGEAANAVAKFKFTKSATIGTLRTSAAPGTTAVHRLRSTTGNSYMLSISPSEMHSSGFVDEGVLGYADGAQHPGEVRLLRFSNHGKWRVLADGAANVTNMKNMGYTVDGPLGWFHP